MDIEKAFGTFRFPEGSELLLELEYGEMDVHMCIDAAKQIAMLMRRTTVSFYANDTLIRVDRYTNTEALKRDFMRATSGFIDRVVGPHPDDELSEEELAADARIEAAYKRLQEEKQAAREAREARKQALEEGN